MKSKNKGTAVSSHFLLYFLLYNPYQTLHYFDVQVAVSESGQAVAFRQCAVSFLWLST